MSLNIGDMRDLTSHTFHNILYFLDPKDIESLLDASKELHSLSNNDLWAIYFRAKFDLCAQAPKEIAENYWQMLCRGEFRSIALIWNRILPQLENDPSVPKFSTQSDIPNWIRMQYQVPFAFTNIQMENLNISRLPAFARLYGTQFYIAGNPVSCIKDAFQGMEIAQIRLDRSQMDEIESWLQTQNTNQDFSRTLFDEMVVRNANKILQKYTGAETVYIAVVKANDET